MAGLLLGCMALPGGLGPLPARGKGALGLQHGCEQPQHQQQHQQHLRSSATSCVALAAACSDGLTAAPVAAELAGAAAAGGAVGTTCAVTKPPRVANHTRRLVVPAYALAGARTRRRRGGLGGGDDELGGDSGGDDGGSFWGGDGGSGGGDSWGGGGPDDEAGDGSSLAARLQDLVLLWSLFCGLAFAQAVAYVSPKPKAPVAPAFAALSYSGIKASLLQRRLQVAS